MGKKVDGDLSEDEQVEQMLTDVRRQWFRKGLNQAKSEKRYVIANTFAFFWALLVLVQLFAPQTLMLSDGFKGPGYHMWNIILMSNGVAGWKLIMGKLA